jgi:hypothetical protein
LRGGPGGGGFEVRRELRKPFRFYRSPIMHKKNLSPLDLALQDLRELTRRIHNDISSKEQPEPAKLFQQGVQTRIFQRAEYGSLVLFGECGDQYFDCVIRLNAAANAKTERISFSAVESATQLEVIS